MKKRHLILFFCYNLIEVTIIMKPVIGIILRCNYLNNKTPINYISESVRRTFTKAGGEIYAILPIQDICYSDTSFNNFPELTKEEKQIIDKNLNMCDGIVFPGGKKLTPYDRYLLEQVIKKDIPVLGICLGMQLMSCYNEEKIIEKNNTKINHRQKNRSELTHKVMIKEDSKLFSILGKTEIMVNSFHDYHGTKNKFYKTVAVSEDGIIEAIEYPNNTFNIGVQWHPEISYNFDLNSRKIIDEFIKEATKKKKKETIITNDINQIYRLIVYYFIALMSFIYNI